MNIPRYAAAAAKLLSRNLPVGGATPGDRARGVATIERAMQARLRRRRLFAAGGALAAAAAALLLTAQLPRHAEVSADASAQVAISAFPSGQGAALARGQVAQPLSARTSLGSGQRIETPAAGGASLQLSTGTSMELAAQTAFRVDSQGAVERFSLQRGELSAHVAKLTGSQRFIVDTPDAEVEVRGTRFRLRVLDAAESCGAGTRTRLEVTEGVVEVRAASSVISVKVGQVWPADCSLQPEQPAAPPEAALRSAPASAPTRDAVRGGAAVSGNQNQSASERASALTPQNDLFAEGVARRRQGDVSGALRAYQALLNRFPASPLAENAMVERMRLMDGSAAARAEAKRYLARYPRGFAVEEARKLATEP